MKRDATYFAGALVIAILMWLQVGTIFELQKQKTLTVRLEVTGVPREYVPVLPQNLVEVIAEGTPTALQRLHEEDIHAVADLSDVRETGIKDVKVDVNYPRDIGVLITPKQKVVRFSVDRFDELRDQPVLVVPQGETPRGIQFDRESVRTFPSKVKIVGPGSLLKTQPIVRASLPMAKLSAGELVAATLEVVGKDGEVVPGLKTEPAEVSIDPRAVLAPTLRTVLVQPTYEGQLPPGYELTAIRTIPTQVDLKGNDASNLDGVVRVLTEPVRLDGLTANSRQRVKVRLPQGVSCDPDEVEVVIQIAPVKGKSP